MKSGFAAILGRPNAGKSTLLNALTGAKVAIVSPKPQTTRDAIQGISSRPEGQIVFVDSPGLHQAKLELGKRMAREIERAVAGCHAVLLVIDAARSLRSDGPVAADPVSIDAVRKVRAPALLVINKIDRIRDKQRLLPLIEAYQTEHPFHALLPISAATGEGLDILVKELFALLPEGPPFYPEDYVTDQPERFLAAELIREQVLMRTEQEVPHATTVIIDRWEESERLLKLSATVYVERPGQKAILLGAQGRAMKEIATKARLALEERLGRKIFLEVFVKVKPKWRDRASFMQTLDRHRFALDVGPLEEAEG